MFSRTTSRFRPLHLDAIQAHDRAKVGVQVEVLAQRDVHAFVTGPDGSFERALQCHARPGDGVEQLLRQRRAMLFKSRVPRKYPLPLGAKARGLEHPDHGICDFRSNSVAGYQRHHLAERPDFRLFRFQAFPANPAMNGPATASSALQKISRA